MSKVIRTKKTKKIKLSKYEEKIQKALKAGDMKLVLPLIRFFLTTGEPFCFAAHPSDFVRSMKRR